MPRGLEPAVMVAGDRVVRAPVEVLREYIETVSLLLLAT